MRKRIWRFRRPGRWGAGFWQKGEERRQSAFSATRLKDYLSEPIDFLKLDIEGAEREVLLDCAGSLTNVDHLFVEYHGYPGEQQGLADILRVIQAAGFRYHIKDAYLVEHPFVEARRDGHMPLQLNIFAHKEVLEGSQTGR